MSPLESGTAEFPAESETTPDLPPTRRRLIAPRFGAASHPGKVRPNNEDHYVVVRRARSREILLTNVDTTAIDLRDDHAWAMIVADGVGGSQFGELASELVLRLGWEISSQASNWIMRFDPAEWPAYRKHAEAFSRLLHARMQEEARKHPKLAGMGTTWTCLYVIGTDAVLVHVGDSRVYLQRQGTLRQLTRDHTLAQHLEEAGVAPAATTPYKHILTSSLGAHSDPVQIDIEHVPLEYGDRVLLCSDGLNDMVIDSAISEILRTTADPQDACDALVERALENGGKDNVTVVVADILPGTGAAAQATVVR